jgi:hypothetical protein
MSSSPTEHGSGSNSIDMPLEQLCETSDTNSEMNDEMNDNIFAPFLDSEFEELFSEYTPIDPYVGVEAEAVDPFTGDMPISSYPVIDTVLNNVLAPEGFRETYFSESSSPLDMYTDSKTLIEALESRLSGSTFTLNKASNQLRSCSEEEKRRDAAKFVNDQLAVRLLHVVFKYKETVGENKTLQYLLDHMKPFDGSLAKVLDDKEMYIKQLQTEVDLYKLKSENTERKMIDLRKVYETRRCEDLNRLQEHIIKGRNAFKENSKNHDKIQFMVTTNQNQLTTIKNQSNTITHLRSEIVYQKSRKLRAREKYNHMQNTLKKQLGNALSENDNYVTQLSNIQERMTYLSKSRFDTLSKHFTDLYPTKEIIGECSICSDDIDYNDMFICSNRKCGQVSHKSCLKRISDTHCQFCQRIDPNLEILNSHEQTNGNNNNNDNNDTIDIDELYESDDDEEYDFNRDPSNLNETSLRFRNLNHFHQNMFYPDENPPNDNTTVPESDEELSSDIESDSESDDDDEIPNIANDSESDDENPNPNIERDPVSGNVTYTFTLTDYRLL